MDIKPMVRRRSGGFSLNEAALIWRHLLAANEVSCPRCGAPLDPIGAGERVVRVVVCAGCQRTLILHSTPPGDLP